jgi:hypothetical protein
MKAIATALLTLVSLPMLAFAKGDTTRITLELSGRPIVTLDAAANQEFRFGPGPGNFIGYPPTPHWQPKSWIVEDWEHPAAAPAQQLARIQATFRITHPTTQEQRYYVVFHVRDPATGQGYVYLPGKGEAFHDSNVYTLRRDEYDGRWYRATAEWTRQVQAAITAGK